MLGRDALRFVDQLLAPAHAPAVIAFLRFALLCPFPGNRFNSQVDGVGDIVIEHDRTLTAVLVFDPGLSEMQDHGNRLVLAAALIGEPAFEPFIGMAESAKRIAQCRGEIDPEHEATAFVAVLSCSKGGLDDKGNATHRFAGDRAVTEGGLVCTARDAELPQMQIADNAEIARLDRTAVLAHGGEQPVDPLTIDRLVIEQGGKWLPDQAALFEHLLLLGAAGEPAKFGEEFSDRASLPTVFVAGDVSGA